MVNPLGILPPRAGAKWTVYHLNGADDEVNFAVDLPTEAAAQAAAVFIRENEARLSTAELHDEICRRWA